MHSGEAVLLDSDFEFQTREMSTNSSSSIFKILCYCYKRASSKYHFAAFTLVNVPFILPLCLYILHQGVQQWRSRAKISHTDFFTYNIVVIQLLCIVGTCLPTINLLFHNDIIIFIGISAFLISCSSIVFFQIFTCFERYMAVIHPVTYLSLKSQTWFLIRNICCNFVWLQCIIQSVYYNQEMTLNLYICLTLTALTVFIFLALYCNLSVLYALIRPTAVKGAKGNQSKRKAFYTITAITGALLVKFAGDVIGVTSFCFIGSRDEACTLWFSISWLSLPNALVLPMLYLHRNGKLPCFKANK